MNWEQLKEFHRSVSIWPSSELELSSVAERIKQSLSCRAAAVWIPELGLRSSQRDEELLGLIQSQFRALRLQSPQSCVWELSGPGFERIQVEPIADGSWCLAFSPGGSDPTLHLGLCAVSQHLSHLRSEAKLREEIVLRDQFLSIASHELKTPLTSIYGILQLQERQQRQRRISAPARLTPEQERQESFAKIVIRQTERLNELIDGLLNVSRIHVGRFLVEPGLADAAELARETVQTRLSVIARDAGVRIQLDCPEHLTAWVDPMRFEEVVTNLGMNAIRFSPEGGVVWIRLKAEAGQIRLTVRDQGPSIPEQDQGRIFQPFERAQRTHRLGGLGLGLFISRQIARLHGGEVVLLESQPDKGNTFEARFPAQKGEALSA